MITESSTADENVEECVVVGAVVNGRLVFILGLLEKSHGLIVRTSLGQRGNHLLSKRSCVKLVLDICAPHPHRMRANKID